MEAFRGFDGVLTGERVGDEEGFLRFGDFRYLFGLTHHLLVERGPACGVEDNDIKALKLGGLKRALGDIDRKLAFNDRKAGHADLLSQNGELLHGGRATHVEGGEKDFLAFFLFQAFGELTGRRGLTRALKACHHDHGWRGIDPQFRIVIITAQHFHERVVDDLDDHLARRNGFDHRFTDSLLFHLADEVLDDRERYVGLEESNADFPHGCADIFLGQRAATGQAVKHTRQSICQSVKHKSPSSAEPVSFHMGPALKAKSPAGRSFAGRGARLPVQECCAIRNFELAHSRKARPRQRESGRCEGQPC